MAVENTQSPDVSIIIPSFNAERYVEQAIASALAQNGVSLEVILVDDGSSDRTLEIVRRIAARDSRLRVFQNPANRGPAYSRNFAIQQARGEWIALLDADDYFHVDRLSCMLSVAEKETADLVADNLVIVSDDGEILRRAFGRSSDQTATLITMHEILKRDRPLGSGVKFGYVKPIIRKKFIQENCLSYNQNIRVGEDFLFYASCLLKGARFLLIQRAYYHYRLAENSVTRDDRVSWRVSELLKANRCLLDLLDGTADEDMRRRVSRRGAELEALLLYVELKTLRRQGAIGRFVSRAIGNAGLLPGVIRAFCRAMRRRLFASRVGNRVFRGVGVGNVAKLEEAAEP
jgi:glycosyltransferase involved in cell wall biosynthesis